MKKKITAVLLAAVVAVTATACQKNDPNKITLADGRYKVSWDAPDENGYTEYMIVDVKNGVPTILEFDAQNDSGFLKSTDTELRDQMLALNSEKGLPEMFPQRAYAKIIESFTVSESNPAEMDFVAGATQSYKSFKVLYGELYEQNMQSGNFDTLYVPYYADGVYKAAYPTYDMRGYSEFLELNVSAGVPTVTAADARNAQGEVKTANDALKPPVNLADVYTALIAQANAPTAVEKTEVAGATSTMEQFAELHSAALDAAHYRTANDFILPKYKDGTYRAEMAQYDNHGYKDYIVIEIKSGYITVTELGSINENGDLKTADTTLFEEYKAGNPNALTAEEYNQKIIKSFNSAALSVLDMENVAGATISANNFKIMLGQLLYYNAAHGNHVTLVVETVDYSINYSD